jgi:hypothetical protein
MAPRSAPHPTGPVDSQAPGRSVLEHDAPFAGLVLGNEKPLRGRDDYPHHGKLGDDTTIDKTLRQRRGSGQFERIHSPRRGPVVVAIAAF